MKRDDPSGIYPIVDVGPKRSATEAERALDRLLEGGAKLIQLRAKTLPDGRFLDLARRFRTRTRSAGAALVINDRADIAARVDADALHLGQDDLPAERVRPWLDPEIAIGLSCHNLDQIARARDSGLFRYLAYGPIFQTRTKERPDPTVGLAELALAVRTAGDLPVIAIGGIGLDQLPKIRAQGARAAAMISALLDAPDIQATTARAQEIWESKHQG